MPEQPTLRLVASYKHLGGILTHGSKLLPEVKHRIAQGCTAFHNYRTKIYKNKNIDVDTRMTVFRATTLAAIHYNAATWSGHNQKTINTWRTGHMNLYRRALYGLFPYQDLLHYTRMTRSSPLSMRTPLTRPSRYYAYGGTEQLYALIVQLFGQHLHSKLHGYLRYGKISRGCTTKLKVLQTCQSQNMTWTHGIF